ncbi:hypothetical protein [Longimicrobium sp.]|uniref:hypothetical protein n=1 Tax=Longimicrobium sp. TaxID=2029185 RepID=UPI002B883DFE|nr:hypothetical protein [Longimicrobium sp.]HSU16412.1 hypothetical protein [Longimicrobium sp.]
MRKLTLQLEDLTVDSFTAGEAEDRRGTVRGHDTRVTEFCSMKPCKPSSVCPTVDTCARHDDDAEQLPPK